MTASNGMAIGRRQALLGIGAGVGAIVLAAGKPGEARAQGQAAEQAEATGPQQGAGFYRFRVGDIGCFSMGDSQFRVDPYPLWGENASEESVAASLRANGLEPKQNLAHVNVLMLRAEGKVWLVDAGYGTSGPVQGQLIKHLATLGVTPTDVAGIVLTHLHGDHFGGLTSKDGSLVFPNATYFVQRVERDFWAGAPDLSKTNLAEDWKKGMIAGAQQTVATLQKTGRLQLVDDGSKLAEGVSVKLTGGHTPGHQTVVIENGGTRFEMLADSVHHHVLSFQHPEWHARFDFDAKEGARVRRAVLERVAADRSLVMCYHTPWPGVGRVVRLNDGFRWVAEPWEW
jgi:glyoxylase-like metal-dependent hydrolase (beta-lactamase superfamily II)